MPGTESWTQWIRSLWSSTPVPLRDITPLARVQVMFAAAMVAALLDVAAAGIGWFSPVLRQQYAEINARAAERLGYTAQPVEFSPLGIFASSLFGGAVGAMLLWGLSGIVVIRGVARMPTELGNIAAAAVVPLPLVSTISVVVSLLQALVGSVRVTPSLSLLFDPTATDLRLFAIVSRIDLGSAVHAIAMVRLLLPHIQWNRIALLSFAAFVVRSAIVAGGIVLIARVSSL
ncbi:MAG: hypothetical protein N2663_05155 [Chlorobi bacterium]|nr:hypothetical protein [Chlorobiota bacterium]